MLFGKIQVLCDLLQRRADAQIPGVVFEIGRAVQAVIGLDQRVFFVTQQFEDLVALPHIELAFFVFRVGIQRGVVAAIYIDLA